MPLYRDDVDLLNFKVLSCFSGVIMITRSLFLLDQKQSVTVSTATTSGRSFSVIGFIMVKCFNPENFVKVMPLALHI